MSQWQPIETAPKGKPVLGFWLCNDGEDPGMWQYGPAMRIGSIWVAPGDVDSDLVTVNAPDFWQELPEEP